MQVLSNFPNQPGVYIFKNNKGAVLYVGKAVNLKSRISSYFTNKSLLQPKTLKLVKDAVDISYILVDSEVEALILEAGLIKKYNPRYNISLKDDKSFKYIVVQKDRVVVSRDKSLVKSRYVRAFGPFPYGDSVNLIVKNLRKIFPFRDCTDFKFLRYKKLKRPCLYGHIKVCPAPCTEFEGDQVNMSNLKRFKRFMLGNKKMLINALEKDMREASKNKKYEVALGLRNQIRKLEQLNYSEKNSFEYIKNPNLLADRAGEEVNQLLKILRNKYPALNTLSRIEFYDISNFSGKLSVGSMVVSKGGLIKKDQYRRFRIKTKDTPDDVSMMFEVISRRLKRKDWSKPSLMVLDGGKSQLSIVSKLTDNFNVPIIALAKRDNAITFFDRESGKFEQLYVSKTNKGLQLLQRLRDEAHRFAISYHRKLRVALL